MDNCNKKQYWNLKKIAQACDLKLTQVVSEYGDPDYVLFRIGETEKDPVAICNHILYKTTADVNRGIYLHKELGIEKYR